MKQVVKNLEAKVGQMKSLESTAIELQEKVTQLEALGELNVSLLLLVQFRVVLWVKHFCFSMAE
jgi:hypothetical protein